MSPFKVKRAAKTQQQSNGHENINHVCVSMGMTTQESTADPKVIITNSS